MARKLEGERLNDAIVEKVRKILDNAERLQEVHIEIDGKIGELPLIEYRVKELIEPSSEVIVEKDGARYVESYK